MDKEKKVHSRRDFIKVLAVPAGAILVAPHKTGEAYASQGNGRGRRWGFLIDLDRCIGCKACAVSCKTEFGVPLGVFRSSVKELEEGKFPQVKRSFLPWLCNHCGHPPCIEVCPAEEVEATFTWPDGSTQRFMKRATYQRPDGIVVVDQDRCIGCGQCVEACPYEVRFLNPAKKTVSPDAVGDNPAEKCDLCVHRLEAGYVPACVNTCQARARIVGDLSDPKSELGRLLKSKEVGVLLPEEETDPQCRYVSLNPLAYERGRDTR